MESILQQLKVLLLEDSEIDIEIVYQKLIESFECPVILDKAQNEACFLHLISNNQYDVILADYTLPGYNAHAALEQVLDICPATPFICVSGTIGEDLAVEMLKQGATDYVIKDRLQRLPFAIRRAIKSALLEQERKNAEQLLLNTIVQNSADLLYLNNSEGRVVFVNEAYVKSFGIEAKDVVGKNALELYHDEEVARLIEENDRNVMQTGEILVTEEIVQTVDGILSTFLTTKTPWRDGDGNIVGVVGVAHNITERKLAEEKLKESEQKALSLIVELEKADKSKNEFLNALSHELRNPLAAVVAGLSLMSLTDDKQKTAQAKEIIQRQINQLCHLVDDLLDITRIENNKIELKKEHTELNKLVSSIAEDYTKFFEEKGVAIETVLSKNSIYIDGDPVRLTQIIGNLLHNALKFTETGGKIHLSVYQEQNEVIIHVEDNGIGINPEFLPDLFEPFKQADKSIDRRDGGLGLGLSIVKGITELHGGSVSAASDGLGKGSKFMIRLPLSDDNLKKKVVE